jgi:hypothetical protein
MSPAVPFQEPRLPESLGGADRRNRCSPQPRRLSVAGRRTERARDPGVELVHNQRENYARNARFGRVDALGRFRL